MGLATGMVWDWDGDWTLCGGSLGRGAEPRTERGLSTTCFDYASRLRYASCLAMPVQKVRG